MDNHDDLLDDGLGSSDDFVGINEKLAPGEVFGLKCPDCGASLLLENAKYGFGYFCEKRLSDGCTGYHGANKVTGAPLGTPGDAATRKARIDLQERIRELLDQDHPGTVPPDRYEVYQKVSAHLGVPFRKALVSQLDESQCRYVERTVLPILFPQIRDAWDWLFIPNDEGPG